METLNILIAGVGGQGTLLASRILGNYALKKGYDCKLSEVHGMAQRGGSVVTHVKMGQKIYSPIISQGDADVLLSFERIEAGRYSHYIKKDGIILTNIQTLMPMSVVAGDQSYPYEILENLSQNGLNIVKINAADIAKKAGNIKSTNIALIGSLTKLINLDKEIMIQAITDSVPEKFLQINLKAFNLGYEAV